MTYYDQAPYECRIEWGHRGAEEAAMRNDITIIVDVLSFSSTTVTALHYGAVVYPYPPPLVDARAYADTIGAKLALNRAEAAKFGGGYSLSPLSFRASDRGKRVVLCSSNGAACTAASSGSAAILIGSLLNAAAVAHAAVKLRRVHPNASITVIPCGEQWESSNDSGNRLRPSIEDYLGAGAIIANLRGSRSPEAELCAAAFTSVNERLEKLIWECGSGRELRMRGYEGDVRHSSQLNAYKTVPLLIDGRFEDIGAIPT